MSTPYLAPGLAQPTHQPDGLDRPYYEGASDNRLVLQRCNACNRFQWGPEWICHRCHSFDLGWADAPTEGVIYSYERVWHPVHPALKDQGPYVVVLVELPGADDVRVMGNLLGDPRAPVQIGAKVHAVFEHHGDVEKPFTLVQWERIA
jgi:uncharacterized OB-fold protein